MIEESTPYGKGIGRSMNKEFFSAAGKRLASLNLRNILIPLGVFVPVFFITLTLTFPFDTIKRLVIAKIEAKTGLKAGIQSLSPLRLSGLEISGLKLAKPSDPTGAVVDIDLVRFRLHCLSFLLGRIILDYDLSAYGGGLSGVMEARGGGRTALAINFKDLDLQKYNFEKMLEKYGQVRLKGKLSGSLSLYFDKTTRRNNQGALELNFQDLKISDTTILTVNLPDVIFQPGAIKMDFKSNAFTISQWEMNGDHLSLSVTGRLTLRENLADSRISFKLKIKPSDEIMDKFPQLSMLASPDNAGWYNINITGPLTDPKIKLR